jgi:hypothetical protein
MWPLILIAAGAAVFWYQSQREAEAAGGEAALAALPPPAPRPLGPWDSLDFDVDLFPAEATPRHIYPPPDSVTPVSTPNCEVIAVPHGFWEILDDHAVRWRDEGLTAQEAYDTKLGYLLPETMRPCIDPISRWRGTAARFFQDEIKRRIDAKLTEPGWGGGGWGVPTEPDGGSGGGGARDRAWPPPNRNADRSRARRLHGRLRA